MYYMTNKLSLKDLPSNVTINFLELKPEQFKKETEIVDVFRITTTRMLNFIEMEFDINLPNEQKRDLTFSQDDIILYIKSEDQNNPSLDTTKFYKIFIRELTYI